MPATALQSPNITALVGIDIGGRLADEMAWVRTDGRKIADDPALLQQGKSDIAACDANLDSGTPTASARGCMAQKGYVLVRRDQAEDVRAAGEVEVVTHPDSRINPAMKQYARLRCRTNSPGTLFRPMIRTPGRKKRHRQPISITPAGAGEHRRQKVSSAANPVVVTGAYSGPVVRGRAIPVNSATTSAWRLHPVLARTRPSWVCTVSGDNTPPSMAMSLGSA